ncbi:MAG: winged helix-turn-helix transcriptional regulator [Rhodobacteraceae bacterium]|nr:winged helix-turn-helix transcriptional regulator [Paracoccaceae bacterium]
MGTSERNETIVPVAVPTHEQVAKIAKALAHPARVQIIETLLRRTTCIGCDLVEEIGLAASTTSEHLRILKEAGLIVGEIARPRVCYSLDPRAIAPLTTFLQAIEAGHLPALPE